MLKRKGWEEEKYEDGLKIGVPPPPLMNTDYD